MHMSGLHFIRLIFMGQLRPKGTSKVGVSRGKVGIRDLPAGRLQMKQRMAGFTLVEIMIVVAIIALLAGLAVPSFMRARTDSLSSTCQNNLRLLDGAVEQYALANSNTLATSWDELVGTNAYLKAAVVCKGGGVYTLPAYLGGKTSCSVHGMLVGSNKPGP